MIKKIFILITVLFLAGCASMTVIHSAQIHTTFNLISITPDVLFFQGQVKIKNPNPLSIKLQSLHYSCSVNNSKKIMFTKSRLPVLPAYSTKTLQFPVQINIASLKLSAIKSLYSSPATILVEGTLYPLKKRIHSPIEFNLKTKIQIPILPEITITKLLTTKDKAKLTATLIIKNSNENPIHLASIFGTIAFQRYRYDLHSIKKQITILPGKKITIPLLAAISSKTFKTPKDAIQLNGDLTFMTEYGKIIIPLKKIK